MTAAAASVNGLLRRSISPAARQQRGSAAAPSVTGTAPDRRIGSQPGSRACADSEAFAINGYKPCGIDCGVAEYRHVEIGLCGETGQGPAGADEEVAQ